MTNELRYDEAPVDGILADSVRCVWTLSGDAAGWNPEPIVSDGCVELVLQLGDPFEQTDGSGAARVRQPMAMIVGPRVSPTVVAPTGRADVIGIRLQPWAAAAVLGVPASELRDEILPLDAVATGALRGLRELRERVGHAATFGERASIALEMIGGARPSPRRDARMLVELLGAERRAMPSVASLADVVGRTTRTVERLFADEIGLGPKALSRVLRIQDALGLSRAFPTRPWGEIALQAGYYDQAHFIREFRALVGAVPSDVRADGASLTATFIEGR